MVSLIAHNSLIFLGSFFCPNLKKEFFKGGIKGRSVGRCVYAHLNNFFSFLCNLETHGNYQINSPFFKTFFFFLNIKENEKSLARILLYHYFYLLTYNFLFYEKVYF